MPELRIGIHNTTRVGSSSTFRFDRHGDKKVDDKVRQELLNELRKQATLAKNRFKKITDSFSADHRFPWHTAIHLTRGTKPGTIRAQRFPSLSRGSATFNVWTRNQILFYLNYGTEVRNKPMNRDYVAKTERRTFNIQAGRGEASGGWNFRSWSLNHGIRGREWSVIYWEKYEKEYTDAMTQALYRGMRKAGLDV